MKHSVSSDTILQRVKELDNGILQTRSYHDPSFCENFLTTH
jgi:hypothetical protein